MTRDEKLNIIADQIQYWLDFQEEEHIAGRLNIDDETHLMHTPYWPSRGMLKEWIKVMRTEANDLRTTNRGKYVL